MSTIFLYASLICLGCFCPNNNDEPRFSRYQRTSGNNNGFETFFDVVKINNYMNKTITIDSFIKLAHKYIDTAKAKMPIGDVTFIGERAGDCLPDSHPDNYDKQVKFYLVSINFDYKSNVDKNNTRPYLRSISIWRNKERYPSLNLDIFNSDEKIKLDSMLSSKFRLIMDFNSLPID